MITKVTVTGADDSVDVDALLQIQSLYPFAEFGILISEKHSLGIGAARFPSKQWLQYLIGAGGGKLNLSCHICGKWTRDILAGNWPSFRDISEWFHPSFQRYQFNTHAEPHEINFALLEDTIIGMGVDLKEIIFQIDGVNEIVPRLGRLPGTRALFDLSHGNGVLPDKWPETIEGVTCGYAGGLSFQNVAEQVQKIMAVSKRKHFWIDAETHLRSDGGRLFDINKVAAFLENAKPFVRT